VGRRVVHTFKVVKARSPMPPSKDFFDPSTVKNIRNFLKFREIAKARILNSTHASCSPVDGEKLGSCSVISCVKSAG
jgi:hypothetical protein